MGMVIRPQASDRLAAYLGELAKVIGHADRVVPLRDYCSGLLATEGRRSTALPLTARPCANHRKNPASMSTLLELLVGALFAPGLVCAA
jgi:SRSO17 transposase